MILSFRLFVKPGDILYLNMPSSWKSAAHWYHQKVGDQGHYFHQQVILPQVKRLISELKPASVLDLGCGQGVLARQLPLSLRYVGVDSARPLITQAKKLDHHPQHVYHLADMTQDLSFIPGNFDLIAFILSLQNCDHPELALCEAASKLSPNGKIFMVLNHPCFRIARQSGWGSDPQTKILYRYLNRYLSPLKIPVRIHPSQGDQSPIAWAYHFSLTDLFDWLKAAHLVTLDLTELTSNKQSAGKTAPSENRARAEFPLFLTLIAARL